MQPLSPKRMMLTVLLAALTGTWLPAAEKPTANQFANPSFEAGIEGWRLDRAGDTAASLHLEKCDTKAGQHAVRVKIGRVQEWGSQFGQKIDVLSPGSTWTFAVLARAVKKPVEVQLQVERSAKPYDRAAAGGRVTLSTGRWTEIHTTFRVEKPFPEGCFAYVSCQQPESEYLVDMFRLYQGPYVPYAEAVRDEAAASGAKLYDTIHPLGDPWAPQQWAARGQWKQIPEDNTADRFQGDAVVINDRLAIVFRTGSPGVSVYGLGPQGPTLRAVLGPAIEGKPAIQSVRILENSLAEVVLETRLAVTGGKPVALRYALGMGQPFVLVEADAPDSWLAVRAPCRFLALPDFFADDIVVDAGEIPVDRAELPSEHLLARFLPGGDSIVMSVTGSQDQDARARLAGSGAERRVETSEVSFGRSKKVWVAVLEGHGVWHQRDVGRNEAGKVLPLDWKAPFAAQWRVDWRLADRLTSSWEMLVETRDGQFEKHGVFGSPATIPANRRRWATVLGWYEYPCWLSRQGQGFLQPLPKSRCEGPALVYPINRVKETPLSAFTVVDVLRATLGVGPCEYVLDVEGQGATMKGRATCATRDALKAIYAAREQRARRQEIEKILVEVVAFVTHIRGRIESYRDFANQTLQYLASQRGAHPELTGFLDEMEGLTRGVLAAYDRRKENIRTVQYVVDLTGKFRGEVLDDESPEAPKKCKAITEAIVQVGGNQDELVGECRQAVKILRQRAGLAMATDPRAASVAKEIRDRTQKVLRNPSTYEAPRH